MIQILVAIAGGLGIAILFGVIHALGLRLIWNGITQRKAYAPWANTGLVLLDLMLVYFLLYGPLRSILKANGYTGDASLLSCAFGMLLYGGAALYWMARKGSE